MDHAMHARILHSHTALCETFCSLIFVVQDTAMKTAKFIVCLENLVFYGRHVQYLLPLNMAATLYSRSSELMSPRFIAYLDVV